MSSPKRSSLHLNMIGNQRAGKIAIDKRLELQFGIFDTQHFFPLDFLLQESAFHLQHHPHPQSFILGKKSRCLVESCHGEPWRELAWRAMMWYDGNIWKLRCIVAPAIKNPAAGGEPSWKWSKYWISLYILSLNILDQSWLFFNFLGQSFISWLATELFPGRFPCGWVSRLGDHLYRNCPLW